MMKHLLACLTVLVLTAHAKADDQRPHILILLADDMGYSDIGCYGGEIEAPHLDALAKNGIRYTQFYNASRCCPTRASLLTGLYPHQTGLGNMTYTGDQGEVGYRGTIGRQCVTIAEVLKPAGYGTYAVGKWHITGNNNKDHWPRQRGFDHFFGTIAGAGSYYDPHTLQEDNESIKPGENFYYTDAISDKAAAFLRQHAKEKSGAPFFMYVAYTAPHWPLHARQEDINKYRGRYLEGWDRIRKQRYARQLEMGIIRPEWQLSERFELSPAWEELDAVKKEEMDFRMAIYAAQVDVMDRGIGRIITALKDTKSFDNTLILFLSDNGACAENGPFGYTKGDRKIENIGKPVSEASYGFSWANASNTPFRLFKWWEHEGGIATPLIAHWSRGIKQPGTLNHEVGHVIDIMPTCVHLAESDYPETFKGHKIHSLAGRVFLPETKSDRKEPLCWEHVRSRAIRSDQWKLVAATEPTKRGIGGFAPGEWELYDMEKDRTETQNLAGRQPDIVQDLEAKWLEWARRVNVLPEPKDFRR